MMEFIEVYISVPYVLAILFGTEAVNNYIKLAKKVPNQIVTLIVAAIMIFVFYKIESPENAEAWQIKILISFLGSIGMYDFIVKPIKDKIKTKNEPKS